MIDKRTTSWLTVLLLLAAALVVQLPMILNPGYYSHDELQWASWSVGRPWADVPWQSLTGWDTFQYRPLTFNIWMQLSRWFFETPYLMHAACVTIGSINALLLHMWLRRLGVETRTAFIACLFWLLNPYATQTHAWVGTMADSLWVMFGLIGIVLVQIIANRESATSVDNTKAALLAFVFTVLALLCKEAALVLPAAFVVAWYGLRSRPLMFASIGSTLAIALYLLLRFEPMLAGTEASAAYSISSPAPLQRWAEYLIFPGLLDRLEPRALLLDSFGQRYWLSIVLLCLMTLSLMLRNWRLGVLWLLAPLAALVPVLPFSTSFGHYAYGASVAAAVALCLGTQMIGPISRLVMILWLAITTFHGLQIADKLRRFGRIQAVLLEEVQAQRFADPQQIIRVRSQVRKFEPVVMRSLFAIPAYRGVTWAEFVVPVTQSDPSANFQMLEDGHIEPYYPSPTPKP